MPFAPATLTSKYAAELVDMKLIGYAFNPIVLAPVNIPSVLYMFSNIGTEDIQDANPKLSVVNKSPLFGFFL